MNRFSTRAAAAALALILGLSPAASASVALGDDIRSNSVSISQNTDLTTGSFWSSTYSDLRTERYFTYKPNENVAPVVSFGDTVLTKSTLSAMAQTLEAGGKRVVGGLNGDYFVVATGVPLGMVITDGVLRSSASYLNAVGFNADGTVFIGQPQLSVTATFSGHTLIVAGVNKIRTATDGYFLLTDDFSGNTQNTAPGVDVILSPVLDNVGQGVKVDLDVTDTQNSDTSADTPTETVSDSTKLTSEAVTTDTEAADEVTGTLMQSEKPTVGGRVSYVVEQVLHSTGSIPIPKGKAVLTINSKSNEWLVSELAALQPGDTVDLDITSADSRWATAQYAVGGMYKLVTNGVVESGLDAAQAPRSAVGIKPDSTAVFYTIDGRQAGYSVGATLTQVAQRLVELGCTEAVCLDGGGSTMFGVTYPNDTAMHVVNKPSDGSQRAVTNAIFLVSGLSSTGTLDHYYVTPGDAMLLAGATVQMTATPVDTGWYAMSSDQTPSWSVTSGAGTVSSAGLFTAGSSAGVTQVSAKSGGVSGSAGITVVTKPDSILLYDETTGAAVTSLALEPGQSIDLKAAARYKKLSLTAQDPCFTWAADSTAGTVDANGLFTAAEKTGSGNLTVSAGGYTITIPVSVTGHVLPLEDFEGELTAFVGTKTIQVALQTGAELVRYGRSSLKLEYQVSAGSATVASFLNITQGERYLNFWLYGDGSGNSLMATFNDTNGGRMDLTLATLDFTGWKYVTARLPESIASVSAFTVLSPEGGVASGTIWLDQLTTSNEAISDTTPPVVTLSVSDGKLLASAVDAITHEFSKDRIRVTYDGAALDFTWDAAEGVATAALPAQDGEMHRLTVTATDLCGNIGRSSLDLVPAAEPVPGDQPTGEQPAEEASQPFIDMPEHWAEPYTSYLYHHLITNGISTDAGLQFQPEKNITRGELFLMVSRWMGLDLTAYQSVELPFADTKNIASWALDSVKAMYSLGIMKGSQDGAVLNANASSPISRAEAMTILGRLQVRGYAEPELTFDDTDAIPAWSLPFVKSLYGQGVVSGFENKVRPADPVKRCEVAKMLYMIL